MLQPSEHLCSPLLDPLQQLCILLMLWASDLAVILPRWDLRRTEQRGTISSLSQLATSLLMQPMILLAFWTESAHC